MAYFGDEEYRAFLRYLREHPEALDEIRPLVLNRELLEVPQRVAELVTGIQDLRLAVETLPSRMDARLDSVESETRATRRELLHAQAELTSGIAQLTQAFNRHESVHGNYLGELLEYRYRRNLANRLGKWIRKPQELDVYDLQERLGVEFSEADHNELENLDFVLVGRKRPPLQSETTYGAVEVSATIDENDVERAHRRAEIMRQAGAETIAIVGGYDLTADGLVRAQELDVKWDLRQPAR